MTTRPIRRTTLILSLLGALLLAAYFIFDPGGSIYAPKCSFHLITGLDCPGCGSQRMIHALLHGHLAEAWHYNAYLLCMLPLIALMLFAAAMRTKMPRLYGALNSFPMIIAIAISMILWGVIRNII